MWYAYIYVYARFHVYININELKNIFILVLTYRTSIYGILCCIRSLKSNFETKILSCFRSFIGAQALRTLTKRVYIINLLPFSSYNQTQQTYHQLPSHYSYTKIFNKISYSRQLHIPMCVLVWEFPLLSVAMLPAVYVAA